MKLLFWNIIGANILYKQCRIKNMITKINPNWIGLSGSKLWEVDNRIINQLMGYSDMKFAFSLSNETVGGILCYWNPSLFSELDITCNQHFVVVNGHWNSNDGPKVIICVYSSNNQLERIDCFNSLIAFVQA